MNNIERYVGKMITEKIIYSLSYLLVIFGSFGMIAFARKFPFVTAIWELKHSPERFLGLNGYQVWLWSWILIILGTAGQILATWC